jgi:ADP-heptose:LPS heptosyltransferase
LASLLDTPSIAWVSLQMGDARAALPPAVFDAAPWLTDFTDTAAAVAALDLVISVDTSVAHLTGAMGKPVWLLNRADTDWRWLLDRGDSPWYPTMRIFRQPTPGDWNSVIEAVISSVPSFP